MADEKVTLVMTRNEYKMVNKVLDDHKTTLYQLKMADALKKNIVEDVHIVKSVLHKSERGA